MNVKTMQRDVEPGIRDGFWFFFELDDHQVTVHNAAMTGRERIWVDDELLVNRLSWSKTSRHTIKIDGRAIEVTIALPSLKLARITCTLSLNGEQLAFAEKQLQTKELSPWGLVVCILVGAALGYVAGYWGARSLLNLFGV